MYKINLIFLMLLVQSTALSCMEDEYSSFEELVDVPRDLSAYFKKEPLPENLATQSKPASPPISCEQIQEQTLDESIIPSEIKKESIKIVLTRSKKKHQCPASECHKIFNTLRELRNHDARTHKNETPYECSHNYCDKSYSTQSSLDLHKIRIHGAKRYKCFLGCEEKYAIRGDLNQHFRRTHGDRIAAIKKPKF